MYTLVLVEYSQGIPINEVKNIAYYFCRVNISGKLILDVATSSPIENRREV